MAQLIFGWALPCPLTHASSYLSLHYFHAECVCVCAVVHFSLLQTKFAYASHFNSLSFLFFFPFFFSFSVLVMSKENCLIMFQRLRDHAVVLYFYVYISLLCVWFLKWLVNASAGNNKHLLYEVYLAAVPCHANKHYPNRESDRVYAGPNLNLWKKLVRFHVSFLLLILVIHHFVLKFGGPFE